MNTMMTALMLENFTDEQFILAQLPVPTAGAGQVLVQIHASGVNPIDYKIRLGEAPYAMPDLPAVLGTDMAGVVVAVGEGVKRFIVGDEVYGLTGGVRGLQGSLAQYTVVDVDLLALKPRNLSMREAAAIPLTFLTAWEGLVDNAKVKAGQNVLVQGGAGGVGCMVVQLAKTMGANVWATGSTAKQSLIDKLGATPLDYTMLSAEDIVNNCTEGLGFDIVYDTVGGQVLQDSLGMARHYGHITSCAAFAEHNLAVSSLRCATLSAVFVLMPMLSGEARAHHGEILAAATRLIEDGKIHPIIDVRHFNLDQAIDAHHAVQDGSAFIKVVIDVE
ncbi:zinc-dependent alcohol dehydrogenase family protein [Serratia liquefaciens]|uniref:zinc-dependent alcohol dehydrogenase family protein n=1 Tax=Serratia liquefaciens TaxID=614 RepID=UPI00061B61B3|nr:zinc-dependent alcohol dehydrogenase family protein [Serratia liquefaciens]AKE11711.1 quinone oxidoreductase [Serratia liquefaciens]MDU4175944.1 zinc-dependent alcohol dehydrogenase family protein [Serratia liquefaciens]RYM72400.1 quinone oxidoreductase [Serratia liquefaciens]CAI0720397.1 Zinc-type alcohol dehydrogenase-like protein SA1988 [Serratia liquefaciens]CAI2524635.1 Zinc-type alcohol dehydrogenase-like protein SA1988 [Serratia liquefaciens]